MSCMEPLFVRPTMVVYPVLVDIAFLVRCESDAGSLVQLVKVSKNKDIISASV